MEDSGSAVVSEDVDGNDVKGDAGRKVFGVDLQEQIRRERTKIKVI